MKSNSPWFGTGVGQLKRIVSWKWGKLYLQDHRKEIRVSRFDVHDGSAWLRSVIRCQFQGWGPCCWVSCLLPCVRRQISFTFVKRYCIWTVVIHMMPRIFCGHSFTRGHPSYSLGKRDITLPTKVRLVKGMVFPVVTYGCESWTIKKAECQRTDAFELRCWRRLLRVPWTGRSNQSVLKESNPDYILEGLMLKL